MCGVIIAKNCLLSATAKYVNTSSIMTNLPMPLWKKGREWMWYSSKYRSAALIGISINNRILFEVATA
jgi:hypothetical protein